MQRPAMDVHRIVTDLLAFCGYAEPTFRSSESPLSAYELQRLENIRRNQEVLASLGLADQPSLVPPPPRPPRIPKRDREATEPSRRSDRQRHQTPMYTPEEIPERPIRRPRPISRTTGGGGGGRACPNLDNYSEFEGCSGRSRARHMLSRTQLFADIDPVIRQDVIAHFGGEMPRRLDGSYHSVYRIELHGTWHYRAMFQGIDYGTFCEPELAAFVSCYARRYPNKSREDVWQHLGIVNLDDLPEDCMAESQSSRDQSSSSQDHSASYSLRPRNGTRSSAVE